jgi:hypothetical protein
LSLVYDNGRTIKDFGEQWLRYSDSEGYYGSLELFSDILSPFLKPEGTKKVAPSRRLEVVLEEL